MKRKGQVNFHFIACCACILTFFIFGSVPVFSREGKEERKFDPTSSYRKISEQGFTVLINLKVPEYPNEYHEMRSELASQLAAIVQVMPPKPLSVIQKVKIWIEWENREGAAEFHPSAVWLTENGYNPEKTGCVEISNTRNFVKWSRGGQPWMMLHELSHAYHLLVFGEQYPGIENAYENALNKLLYTNVAYIKGGNRRAYALTDSKEYFAELSEAYFGKNDFYPFTNAELEKYDPVGYQLMKEVWGTPKH